MFPQVLSYFVRKVQKYDREAVEDGTSALNPCHCKVLVEQPVNPRKQVISIHTLWGRSNPSPVAIPACRAGGNTPPWPQTGDQVNLACTSKAQQLLELFLQRYGT